MGALLKRRQEQNRTMAAPSRKRNRKLLGAALALPFSNAFTMAPPLNFAVNSHANLDVREELGSQLLDAAAKLTR